MNEIEVDRNYYMQNNCIYPEEHFVPGNSPGAPLDGMENGLDSFCGRCGGNNSQGQSGPDAGGLPWKKWSRMVEATCHFQMDDVGAIDSFSRWFFPLAFFTLMFGYWAFYLSRDYNL